MRFGQTWSKHDRAYVAGRGRCGGTLGGAGADQYIYQPVSGFTEAHRAASQCKLNVISAEEPVLTGPGTTG